MCSDGGPDGRRWRSLVFADLERYGRGPKAGYMRLLKDAILDPGVLAILIVRSQQVLYERGHELAAFAFRHLGVALCGLDFVPGAEIGLGLRIHHPQGIVIGRGVRIGTGCTLFQGVTLGERGGGRDPGYPVIGDDVVIAAGAAILGDIRIGNRATIGANAVVLNDVPADTVATGVPASAFDSRSAS